MSIRVGRRVFTAGGGFTDPSVPDYTPIVSLTKSTQYGCLSPYELTDTSGRLLENVWQFGKIYRSVPPSTQRLNRYSSTIAWQWPAEVHWDEMWDAPTDAYWTWRQAGMACPHPVRYPVGYNHRSKCIGYIVEDEPSPKRLDVTILDYVAARKRVYLPMFADAVRRHPEFAKLRQRLGRGENLMIIEVDGPHQESLKHYQETYGVDADFIVDNTMLATEENLHIMLEDTRHPFGHGYCLAAALLDIDLTDDSRPPRELRRITEFFAASSKED